MPIGPSDKAKQCHITTSLEQYARDVGWDLTDQRDMLIEFIATHEDTTMYLDVVQFVERRWKGDEESMKRLNKRNERI